MAEALSAIHDFCGLLLLRFIDLWLYTCGRRHRRSDVPWLVCPTGPPDRIGDRWYEQLAASENLTLKVSTESGLIPNWNDLRGPNFDPDKVHPAILDFYQHTSRYTLEAWSEVTLFMRFFLWGLVTFASRRMQQLNFPISSMELAGGMTSEVIELTDAELREVAGGSGSASFSFTGSASGTNAAVSGTLSIASTASSASISGSFSSSST